MVRMRKKCSKDPRGFTLLEVLATLVLIGIVLPAAMKGVSLAIEAGARAKSSVEAASLADSKLKELIGTNLWQSQVSSGDFGPDWPDYRWVAYRAAALAVSGNQGVSQLVVEVTWTSRGIERSIRVSTLVYGGSQ